MGLCACAVGQGIFGKEGQWIKIKKTKAQIGMDHNNALLAPETREDDQEEESALLCVCRTHLLFGVAL